MLRSRSLTRIGKSVYQKHLTTNLSGIIHDEFALDRTSALGNYYVQVTGGQGPMTGNFEVQEYKKPEYEVHVAAEKARVLQGAESQASHRLPLLLWRTGERRDGEVRGVSERLFLPEMGRDRSLKHRNRASKASRKKRKRTDP